MKLTIEKPVYGGDGLARGDRGQAMFVPFVLPGELVDVAPVQEHVSSARAQLVTVVEASSQRVEARCKHFGTCGGCQYQHAAYESQLAMKADILSETMERAGLRDRPRITLHAGEPWGYRNRIRLRVEFVNGTIEFGYNLRETREFLPICECPIAAPVLWRAASALQNLCTTDRAVEEWMRATAEVELFTTGDQRYLQMNLHLRRDKSAGWGVVCERVKDFVPELVGAGAGGVSWGRGGLMYVVENREYWVSRGGFFQVNRWLLPKLMEIVVGGRKGLLAWDLFAGVGLFSRALAASFAEVVAVEASASGIRDLRAAKEKNLRGLRGSVVDFLRRAVFERDRPNLVVMDPPRAGAGPEVCRLLARMQVPQIVYVSCDPTTLARDLRVMVDSGYDLAELHLVDLFPQTYHLETVAVLQRSAR